jgi:hypothetical protein
MTDRTQHHDNTTKPNTPPHPTEGNNDDTNTWQQTTTNTPHPTPPASTTLMNCTPPATEPTPPPCHGPTPMDTTMHPDATPPSTLQTPAPTNNSPHQTEQQSNTGQHHPDQKSKNTPEPHNVTMEETTNPTDNHTTPMELDPHDSEDDTDTGTEHKNDNTFDDLSDPENSSGNDSDTETQTKESKYKLQGPTRVQRKIYARERRTRNNARRTAAKNGDASPLQPHHKSYRIQIKFCTINKQEKHAANAMQHVSEFIKHWNMIDEDAELTNIKGDNIRWSYKKGTHPAKPPTGDKLHPRLLQQGLHREHHPQHDNRTHVHH